MNPQLHHLTDAEVRLRSMGYFAKIKVVFFCAFVAPELCVLSKVAFSFFPFLSGEEVFEYRKKAGHTHNIITCNFGKSHARTRL